MDLYSEIILDYFKNPKNKGPLKGATHKAEEFNPLCGDKIKIYLKTDKSGKIIKAHFDGEGCAISQAGASMLTEILEGKTLIKAQKIKNETIYGLLGIPISPARVKCALLSLVTAKKAINTKPIPPKST